MLEGAPYTGGGANGAGFGIMIDRGGDVWQGNFGFAGTNCATPDKVLELSHSVSKYDRDGNAISPGNTEKIPGGYPGDGNIFGPQGMSSDPNNGNIWISNCRNNKTQGNQVTLLRGGDQNDAGSFAPFDFTNLQDLNPGYLPKPFGMTVDRSLGQCLVDQQLVAGSYPDQSGGTRGGGFPWPGQTGESTDGGLSRCALSQLI
jgi:hypothetical protein